MSIRISCREICILSLFLQESIAVLQNNFVMVLSAIITLDIIWWLCTSVMKATH